MNINRLLVIGGSGFAGSHIVRHMLLKYPDMQVVNLDNLSTGTINNTSDIKTNPRYHFVHADMRQTDVLDAILSEGVDAVVNAAGVLPSPMGQDRAYIDGNISAVATLLDRIAHYNSLEGNQVQRFIQLSTYEVYGNEQQYDPYRLQPLTRYAASKAAGDMECMVRMRNDRIPAIILRACELYGTAQHSDYGFTALRDHTDQWFDMRFAYETYEWLSAEDCANAVDFLIYRGKVGQIYHAGSGEYASIRDIQKAIQGGTAITPIKQRGDYPFVPTDDMAALGWKSKNILKNVL